MSGQPLSSAETLITRRQSLQIALGTSGGLVAGNLLAACTDSATTQQSSSSLTPTPRHQTVIVNQGAMTVYDSFNPFVPNGEEYEAGFTQICKEYLFYYNLATGEIKPWLAEKWQYNADYTQLTFTLNPKVHWNDGVPFTAKDVRFTIEMGLSNPALSYSTAYTPIVEQITTPDDHTVVFSLKQSNPRFHLNFICDIVGAQLIVPQHIWSKQDPMKFRNNPPVLTGPYKFERSSATLQMYIWKKDPNYWNKDVIDPKPQYVVYRSTPTTDSEIEEFKRAQIDVTTNAFDYIHAIALKNSGYQHIIVETKFRDPCPRAFFINCDASKGILADPRMHWAISYLVDRQLLATIVSSVPTVPAQFPWADYVSNAKWSNAALATKYPLTYAPHKAAALLDEMGVKMGSDGKRTYNGQPVQYEIITSTQQGQPEYMYAQKLADEMTKIGISTVVRYYSGAVYYQRLLGGEFDIATLEICGSSFDPSGVYSQFEIQYTKPIGQRSEYNIVRARYQELDSLATQFDNVDPNSTEGLEISNKALEAFYKYLPYVPIYQQTFPAVFNTTYWTGWPSDDNLYQVPACWWGQFLFVIANLKPTGAS